MDYQASMNWAQRLRRAFNIETGSECGGAVKVVACINDTLVVERILTRLQRRVTPDPAGMLPESPAPPADLYR